jgi:hypothetical protein
MLKRSLSLLLLGIFSSVSLWAQEHGSLVSYITDSLLSSSTQQVQSEPIVHHIPMVPYKAALGLDCKVLQLTVKTPIVSKPISVKAVLIPTAMIAYGAFSLSNKELKSLNLAVRKGVWEGRNGGLGKKLPIDNFSLAAPAVAVYALNMAGVKGKNNFVDRSLMLTMSSFIGDGIVSSVKNLSGVIRPDSSNALSFPSGHTAQAFIAAEFMRQEYKHLSPWYGVAAYTVAAGTGFLRMYNNKHWFNDVIAGAGVGILSTRLSYWLYPKLKHIFVKEGREKQSGTLIMPTYQNGAVGLGLVHAF